MIGVSEARNYFPRGLGQPETGYRFSVDALLLACFAKAGKGRHGVDLGTGCGAAALGLLLRQGDLSMAGVELDTALAANAKDNARLLGFENQFEIIEDDIVSYKPDGSSCFDFALANPPYRAEGRGRISPDSSRRGARFEGQADLMGFCACASRLVRSRGRFYLVHLPERLPEIFTALDSCGFAPKRLRLVHGRNNSPARIALVDSVRNGNPGLEVEPPLILYSGEGDAAGMTSEALAFCPFLECNG